MEVQPNDVVLHSYLDIKKGTFPQIKPGSCCLDGQDDVVSNNMEMFCHFFPNGFFKNFLALKSLLVSD